MTAVPIGSTINQAIELFLKHKDNFAQWYIKRGRKVKPGLNPNLLGLTLSLFILKQLQGLKSDFESCYSEIKENEKKINRLKFQLALRQVFNIAIFYFFFVATGFLVPFAVSGALTIGGTWLVVGVAVLAVLVFVYIFYLIASSIEWMRFAYLTLLSKTDRSVAEVINYCKGLIKNTNIIEFNLVSRLITANLLTFPFVFCALGITVITRFFPSEWGWFGLILLPFVIWVAIEIYFFNLTLNTCYYYKILCLEEGWDINLVGRKMEIERKVKLLTPESVELEFSLAGIGNRALALLVDYGILFLLGFCLLFVWLFVGEQLSDSDFGEEISKWFNAFMFLLYFLIYAGYFVFFETIWSGQTPGKKFAKVRVIQANGRPVGLPQATLRALLRAFDDFLSLGVILIVFGKTEKRLGDIVAQTIVIQEPRRAEVIDIQVSPNSKKAKDEWSNLGITDRLSVHDFAVVKDYLQRRSNFNTQARLDVSDRLIKQLQSKLELTDIPLGFTKEEHLEGIYLSFSESYGKY